MRNWIECHPLSAAIFVVILFVVFPWVSVWVGTYQAFSTEPNGGMTAHGQFGDAFGALNALFTGLAFAGLIITVFLQQDQVSHATRATHHRPRRTEQAGPRAIPRGST